MERFSIYTNPTDRNGYIPVDSCHHAMWLKSVPRSQFTRIRRNCSNLTEYFQQTQILRSRFINKGYDPGDVDREIMNIAQINRESLLTGQPKSSSGNKHKWSLLTNFSIQHKQIKAILARHWRVLKNDPILGPVLPERSGIIFKGAPSIRGQIASNVIDPPRIRSFFHNMKGFFPCKRCNVCLHNISGRRRTETFFSTSTGKEYQIKHFLTCETRYVVYLITCPCKKQYVGRTIRTLSVRGNEHIANIKKGLTNHSVPKHFLRCHNQNPNGIQFQVIDKFIPHWRGASMKRGVSRLETFWIHQLKCYLPFGLNVDWDINAFINQS